MKSFMHAPLKRRIIIVFLGLIVWCTIAIPTTYKIVGWGKPDVEKSPFDLIQIAPEENNFVEVDFRILSTDLAKRTIKAYVNFYLKGIYGNEDNTKWNTNVELQFKYKNFPIKKGSTVEPVIFDIPLQTGNLLHYPFDSYDSYVWLLIHNNSTNTFIPTNTYVSAVNQTTLTSFYADQDFESSGVGAFKINIKRTPLVYIFCVFISCVTWGLTIVVSNIAADYVFFNRELPNGLLGIGIAMLFAMPTLRKAQPDIPDIGCAIDFLCFIWCETVIAISASMILYNWLLRFDIAAPPPPQETKII